MTFRNWTESGGCANRLNGLHVLLAWALSGATAAHSSQLILNSEKPGLADLFKQNLSPKTIFLCSDGQPASRSGDSDSRVTIHCERTEKSASGVPAKGVTRVQFDRRSGRLESFTYSLGQLVHWQILVEEESNKRFNTDAYCEYSLSPGEIRTCGLSNPTDNSCLPKRRPGDGCWNVPRTLASEDRVFIESFIVEKGSSQKPSKPKSAKLGPNLSIVWVEDWGPDSLLSIVGTFSSDGVSFLPNANAGTDFASGNKRQWIELQQPFVVMESGKITASKSEKFLDSWIQSEWKSQSKLIQFLSVPTFASRQLESFEPVSLDAASDFIQGIQGLEENRVSLTFKHPACREFSPEEVCASGPQRGFTCNSVTVVFHDSGRANQTQRSAHKISPVDCKSWEP